MEARPRLSEQEIRYIFEALKDREDALKALCEVQVRNAAMTATRDQKMSDIEAWRIGVFRSLRFTACEA